MYNTWTRIGGRRFDKGELGVDWRFQDHTSGTDGLNTGDISREHDNAEYEIKAQVYTLHISITTLDPL